MSNRFRLALSKTTAEHWQAFEYLASAFLSDEFGHLRTLAAPSGDEGRDATLFQPDDDASVALQYSVQQDWYGKVRRTARRLSETHQDVTVLVYATPQRIGAEADALKARIRKDFHVHLDIRDEHFFAERAKRSNVTNDAAERYCRLVVDPLLEEAGALERTGAHLTSHEARAALLYLVLERQDADMERQLTKLCFDALVLAVLRDTTSESRLDRPSVYQRVEELIPSHDRDDVKQYVDRALERLNKQAIRHWTKEDEFCLTYEERIRIAEGLARLALLNEEFEAELIVNFRFVAEGLHVDLSAVDVPSYTTRLRRVLERFLFERGEAFVESLRVGQEMLFIAEEMHETAKSDVVRNPDTSSIRSEIARLTSETLERTLRFPGEGVQRYLRAVADGYTLMAFLRETPNVQSAVSKLFSHGEMWLDTTVVLPLLAEELLEQEERGYSRIFRAAQGAGVRFFVSSGVIEEVNSHIEACLRAWRSPNTWNGRTPFLLASYVWSGREPREFARWVENFRGTTRPTDDLIEYLSEEQGLEYGDLRSAAESCPEELRWHAQAYWQEIHERRRPREQLDPEITRRLAEHDVEMFLGVIGRRGSERVGNPFGYTTWWITLDRFAGEAAKDVGARADTQLQSPVLSVDFLTYYLVVGPARRQLAKASEQQLPLLVDQSLLEAVPRELMKAADQARSDVEGQDDRIVRRRIRDHLDQEKLRAGPVTRTGIEAIKEDIRLALQTGLRG